LCSVSSAKICYSFSLHDSIHTGSIVRPAFHPMGTGFLAQLQVNSLSVMFTEIDREGADYSRSS
jgi:hypothetical protein